MTGIGELPSPWADATWGGYALTLAGALSCVMLPDDETMPEAEIKLVIERVSGAPIVLIPDIPSGLVRCSVCDRDRPADFPGCKRRDCPAFTPPQAPDKTLAAESERAMAHQMATGHSLARTYGGHVWCSDCDWSPR